MYFVQGRPRFWVPGFDTAHLVLPALLALAVGLLVVLPNRAVTASQPAPVARQLLPTTILAPVAGTVLPAGQGGVVVEGLAQPGGVVRLYWFAQPIGEPTLVGTDGRWRFTLGNLPVGQHTLRVSTLAERRYLWSPELVITVAAPAAKAPVKPAPAKKPASAKKPVTKAKP